MDSNSWSPVSGETPERPVNRVFAESAIGSPTAAHWSDRRRYLATQHGIVGAVQRNRQPAADQSLAVYLVAAGGENIGEFGDVTVILHPSLPKRESCLRPMYGRRRKAQEQF
jgi:hypothetical protein